MIYLYLNKQKMKKKTAIISLNCQKLTFNIVVTALQLQRFEKAGTNSTNFSRMMNYLIISFKNKILSMVIE